MRAQRIDDAQLRRIQLEPRHPEHHDGRDGDEQDRGRSPQQHVTVSVDHQRHLDHGADRHHEPREDAGADGIEHGLLGSDRHPHILVPATRRPDHPRGTTR
ncbi:hypothetical protein GCM10025881_31000 [Pseudolysinimonas kribbensis]|uniref:Uncharacterized protein n=1 Tax=Pseudolysinimonas kribbensis TaxID=433641 RepID=A0ABQ6KCU4_9MICO|nr:hypothetical protein GCM10025881_31000 [Pseudolysinimonas kribbensis]